MIEKKIRVLQVVSMMERGGLETYLMDVYRRIDRNRVQFDFLVHSPKKGAYENEIECMGGKIFRVRSRRENVVGNIYDLIMFFKDHPEYNIIHMHESSMSYVMPLLVARMFHVPVVIMHSRNNGVTSGKATVLLHYINRAFQKMFITDAFSISKEAAIWMFGKRASEKGRVRILNNGVDTKRFGFDESVRKELRSNLGFTEHDVVLGHIGRFSPQKNHVFLINVFSRLHDIDTSYKLLLIGNGSEKEKIKKIVNDKGLEQCVSIIDSVPNAYDYYNVMDVFVLPSLFEGWGRVLVEAQCNGLPVFATKDSIPESVKILSNFKFLSLEESIWVDEILKAERIRVPNSDQLVSKKGYEMDDNAIELENIYFDLLKRRDRNVY